jgi:hypothetical protein
VPKTVPILTSSQAVGISFADGESRLSPLHLSDPMLPRETAHQQPEAEYQSNLCRDINHRLFRTNVCTRHDRPSRAGELTILLNLVKIDSMLKKNHLSVEPKKMNNCES